MKKKNKKSLKKLLDKEFSLIVRKKGRCSRCGKKDNLQCAHIFSRSLLSTRWNLDNAICLCGGCHLWWAHKNPVEFTEFVKEILGEERFDALRLQARTTVKWTEMGMEYHLNFLRGGMK